VQIAHNVLVRAIRDAERDGLVGQNVAALVDAPKGQRAGWKSLTLEQAVSPMAAAKGLHWRRTSSCRGGGSRFYDDEGAAVGRRVAWCNCDPGTVAEALCKASRAFIAFNSA
jgi:hypothetical protein